MSFLILHLWGYFCTILVICICHVLYLALNVKTQKLNTVNRIGMLLSIIIRNLIPIYSFQRASPPNNNDIKQQQN